MRNEPTLLGKLIEEWMKKRKKIAVHWAGSKQEESSIRLVESIWDEIVGKRIARVVIPYKLERGILYVVTESSSWAQEISFIKSEIMERINKMVGKVLVSDIYCRIGTVVKAAQRRHPKRGQPTAPTPSELKRIKLPRHIEQYVDEKVSMIQDDELRELVRRVFSLHMKLKLWRERHGFKQCKNCGEVLKASEKVCPMCFTEN